MSTPLDDGTLANGDVIETIHVTQLFPIVEALEDNQTNYREDIGVADAFKVDFSGGVQANEITAYQAGQQIVFKAANANTGASTLQVVGPSGALSAKPLNKNGGEDLEAGDIQAGQMVLAIYNDEGTGRFDALGVLTGGAVDEVEDGTSFYREDEGSVDAYQVDASGGGSNPVEIDAYAPGQMVVFKAANANTGAATLQIVAPGGALSAKALTKFGNVPLQAGDIQADQIVMAVYNDAGGGRFEMMDAPPTAASTEDGTGFFREDDGSADAYQVDCSGYANPNVISFYEVGQLITFKADNANTGPSTLQVVGPFGPLDAVDLTKFGGQPLEAGDIQASQIVMVVYNDYGGGRFEMMDAPATASSGGGGGEFVGCQVARGFDLQIFATNQTDLTWDWDHINEGMDRSAGTEWIIADRAGDYEVSLALEMDMPASETLTVEMFKGDAMSYSNYSVTEFDLPAGLNQISLPPMLVQLEVGERVKWMLTSANDDPTVKSGDLRSRCTVTLVEAGGGSSAGTPGASSWLYGDGMDGNGNFTSDDELWEHKFYEDLFIDEGVSLCTNGFKVHVSGTLTNNGIIHCNGTDGEAASGATPGGPGSGRNFQLLAWEGHAGGAGSLQEGETVSSVDEQAYYARGGNGGDGSYGAGGSGEGSNTYGSARNFQVASAYLSGLYDGDAAWSGMRTIGGGMGGGGGTGNDDDAAGGGGGGSGSVLWIAARALAGSGELQSKGGNGGDAGGTDAGGGGGGGGGIIYLLTDQASSPYTHSVDGGIGGVGGGGAGNDGGNGDSGLYVFRGGL